MISASLEPSPIRRIAEQILLVDDEQPMIDLLRHTLRQYEPHSARTGDEALEKLQRHRIALMICDISLERESGLDVVAKAIDIDPNLAVVMLTGHDDAATARAALLRGACDYLVKPAAPDELRAAVQRALHQREVRLRQERTARIVHRHAAEYGAELEEERRTSRTLSTNVVTSLVNAMEARDLYLRGHSRRVADLAAAIAETLGLHPETVDAVRIAGALHDIGKIGIPESILHKNGPLTPEEFDVVKQHVNIGMEILAPLSHLGPALTYVQHHHEHFDGSGYPNGLFGEQISLGGRILVAADAFDALTSRRPYREPMGPLETLEVLRATTDTLLDPAVFDALRRTVRREERFREARL